MPHVVTLPCFGCKTADCATVCPCNCFREGQQMLYIEPEECIDCEACVSACPVEAIYRDDDVPQEWTEFIALNAEMAAQCPPVD